MKGKKMQRGQVSVKNTTDTPVTWWKVEGEGKRAVGHRVKKPARLDALDWKSV